MVHKAALLYPLETEAGERHLANIRQLTFGGENAEAYFSADGLKLIFQSTRGGRTCDQQYVMNADGSGVRLVSTGSGKTTCGYFFDHDRRIFFSSSHASDTSCPPRPISREVRMAARSLRDLLRHTDGSDLRAITASVLTRGRHLSRDGSVMVSHP